MKKSNNYAFIDSQNLNLGIRSQNWKLDFKKFRIYLKDRFKINEAFIFIGYIKENENLYKKLESYNYKLIFKPTSTISKNIIKGNVDAELVLHTMIEYDNYEKAVIISGDGDFYCLIKYLEEKNKLERLIIPNQFIYSYLLETFRKKKQVTYLTGMKKKIGV